MRMVDGLFMNCEGNVMEMAWMVWWVVWGNDL